MSDDAGGYTPAMRHPSPLCAFASLLVVAALPGQDDKPKPQPKPKATGKKEQPRKDDATTAKDPVIVALDKALAKARPNKKGDDWRGRIEKPPEQKFARERTYLWHLQTNRGEITIELFADTAPMHVTSTIWLTRAGFYDGLTFHRVIAGFMAQGGCPKGNGTGGPGYQMDGEFDDKRKHDQAGVLSMANSGPGTEGSQFFITFDKTPHLDGKHTIVGAVKDGMDAVRALEEGAGPDPDNKPKDPLVIEKAWVQVQVASK